VAAPQPNHTPDEPCLDWELSFTWIIPTDWISGIYAAKCADGASIFYINFIVNPDRAKRNPLLALASVNTLNAYNSWGGYSRDGNIGEDFTYCRPNPAMNLSIRDDLKGIDTTDPVLTQVPFNSRHLTRAELWVLNWMQEQGFAYDVYTDLDWHYSIDSIDDYESLVLNTHSEYWTLEMYRAREKFLSNGGNLIYLGGNAIYEHVEISSDGLTMRCFGKIVHHANLFRNIGMLEDSLLGIRYVNNLALQLGGPYTIRYKNRFCTINIFVGKVIGTRGWNILVNRTGLEQGAASGWETDRINLATGPLVNLSPRTSLCTRTAGKVRRWFITSSPLESGTEQQFGRELDPSGCRGRCLIAFSRVTLFQPSSRVLSKFECFFITVIESCQYHPIMSHLCSPLQTHLLTPQK